MILARILLSQAVTLRRYSIYMEEDLGTRADRAFSTRGHTSKPGPDSDSDPDSDSKKIRTREKPGPGLEKNPDSCLTKPGLDF